MAREFQYDVFLSHNAQDKPRVRRLAERLRAAGLRVRFNEWMCPSPVGAGEGGRRPGEGRGAIGDDIHLAIGRGLEASRTLVLCLSPSALGSDRPELACLAEASWRRQKRSTVGRGNLPFRDPANAGRRFIPLMLADCKLPDTLRRYRHVDFRDETDHSFRGRKPENVYVSDSVTVTHWIVRGLGSLRDLKKETGCPDSVGSRLLVETPRKPLMSTSTAMTESVQRTGRGFCLGRTPRPAHRPISLHPSGGERAANERRSLGRPE